MSDPRGHTVDPNFTMPTAKEPPTQPAMPPSNAPMGEEVWKQREDERRGEAEKDRRAKALELAVSRANANEGTPPAEVFVAADQFLGYIETGARPA